MPSQPLLSLCQASVPTPASVLIGSSTYAAAIKPAKQRQATVWKGNLICNIKQAAMEKCDVTTWRNGRENYSVRKPSNSSAIATN